MGKTRELTGCRALITGASAGIGESIAQTLAASGVNLILMARREDKIKTLAASLMKKYSINVDTYVADIRHKDEVEGIAKQIIDSKQSLDILVNNAGLARGTDKLQEGNIDDWEQMIDTNVKGLLYMTRYFVPFMLQSSSYPQVINIGSTAGIQAYPGGAVYCGTKSAVGFLSDGLRIDTVDTPLRVCNIRPGLVETEFSVVRFKGDKDKADNVYKDIEPLYAQDIADTVEFVLTRPTHVQITELTVMPNCQASGTIVHRKGAKQ
ncbi:SDR family NAD(P)-dependent oxidoreductase [Spirochaeta cellobiosiphila]|uniref:SDR family NAD(P)-dependent oxidoreductase n=1 Tax=Spirochaeta cellobiosiphila TaxID=504483 RepID=UPI00040A9752|nr:SDR family NAD(P)-dependent oxidoreductase [Spirochaeta cellobiosiphila]